MCDIIVFIIFVVFKCLFLLVVDLNFVIFVIFWMIRFLNKKGKVIKLIYV